MDRNQIGTLALAERQAHAEGALSIPADRSR